MLMKTYSLMSDSGQEIFKAKSLDEAKYIACQLAGRDNGKLDILSQSGLRLASKANGDDGQDYWRPYSKELRAKNPE